ncbi:MAG: hypothetical protein WCQ16_03735 [Verrucomicrobiae bacterium]
MRTALLFLISAATLLAAEIAPRDLPLPDVKATIQIPEGWTVATESEDGVFVYHFGKAGKPGKPEAASITLSVTTKVPERAEQSPAAYAAALVDMSQDDGKAVPVQKGEIGGLPSLRSEYHFEGDAGKMRAVNTAIPNDKTGTLYFFSWQAPVEEALEREAVREKILASVKFDPAF